MQTLAEPTLLRAVVENPDDDAPRLVLADWLEEAGDADRAEFIRIQVDLARLSPADPRRPLLLSREQELSGLHYVEWQSELPQLEEVAWGRFERGFVSAAHIGSAEVFAHQADAIFSAAPVQEVRFSRIFSDDAKRIAVTPQLGRLHVLDLEEGSFIGNPGSEALANSPYLGGLRVLKLRGNAIGPAGARALANARHLGPLVYLDLDHNAIYDDGIQAIVESPRMRHLEQLSLGWTQCSEMAARAMARSSYLANVRWLYLSGNPIGDDGTQALAQSKHLGNVTELFLEKDQIGNRGAYALAESRMLAGISWLYLKGNRIGDEGARALADSPYLQQVKELVLLENPITEDGSQRLRQRFGSRVWLS